MSIDGILTFGVPDMRLLLLPLLIPMALGAGENPPTGPFLQPMAGGSFTSAQNGLFSDQQSTSIQCRDLV